MNNLGIAKEMSLNPPITLWNQNPSLIMRNSRHSYSDDLQGSASKSIASQTIQLLETTCYHNSMILVPKITSKNTLSFLESQIQITKGTNTLTSFLINPCYQQRNPQILSAQHFLSLTGETTSRQVTRMGTIMGKLAAAEASSP